MNLPGHVGGYRGAVHVDFTAVLAVSALSTAALCLAGETASRHRGSRASLLVPEAVYDAQETGRRWAVVR